MEIKILILFIIFKLMEKYKSLSYCVIINSYNEDEPKISLRSREDVDLLELNYVKGHRNACGISADEIDNMKQFTEDLKSKKIYELGYKD